MIPNIVHFNYGLAPQNEDFLFVYYLAVLSCKIINNPDKIYFFYHYEPRGYWWEKTKQLVEMIKVDIPTHIGEKTIKKIAHKSDVLRLEMLKKIGGVYLDIDTICVRSYKDLLHNKFVIGNEVTESGRNMGLCNAIMMSEPNSSFLNDWINNYEVCFKPDGWQESSTFLPRDIAKMNKNLTILPPSYFLLPSWENIDRIFEKPNNIPEDLITLHYCNHYSIERYLKNIKNFDWIIENSHTLFGKIMIKLLEKIEGFTENLRAEQLIESIPYKYFIENIEYEQLIKLNNISDNSLINNKQTAQMIYLNGKNNGIIYSDVFKNYHEFGLPVNRVIHNNLIFNSSSYFLSNDENVEVNITKFQKQNYFELSIINKNPINLTIKNNEVSSNELKNIIYNIESNKKLYIFPEDFKIETPVRNIEIIPVNIINDSKYIITTHLISKNECYVRIRRSDKECGWTKNMYLDIKINNKEFLYFVGKNLENYLNIIIKTDEILEPVILDYEQKIPKVIYQTWKTYPNNISFGVELENTILSFKEKNPEYHYKFFNDSECRDFIEENFTNDVLVTYDTLIPSAFKADLFRYCLIYKNGGIYVDLKMIDIVPLREIIKSDDECILVNNTFEKNHISIYNAFICSVPNNPIFLECINKIVENVKNLYYPIDLFDITGPSLLYRVVKNNQAVRLLKHPNLGLRYDNHNNGIFDEENRLIIQKTFKNYYKNFKGGSYVEEFKKGNCYKTMLNILTVYETESFKKIRYGNYVLLDIDNYDKYIGCGIKDNCEFEQELIEDIRHKNLLGICFDNTIDYLPENFPETNFKWERKNILFKNTDITTNLEEYSIDITNGLLKMDIEGHEWKWINSLNNSFFNKFKQIILEVHGVFLNNWEATIQEKIDALKKLNETHYIIHIHGNNQSPIILNNGNPLPTVLEITYIRKDLVNNIKLNSEALPSSLDYPRTINRKDYDLNFIPFVNPKSD